MRLSSSPSSSSVLLLSLLCTYRLLWTQANLLSFNSIYKLMWFFLNKNILRTRSFGWRFQWRVTLQDAQKKLKKKNEFMSRLQNDIYISPFYGSWKWVSERLIDGLAQFASFFAEFSNDFLRDFYLMQISLLFLLQREDPVMHWFCFDRNEKLDLFWNFPPFIEGKRSR